MIIVTGGAGFIGSAIVAGLNKEGIDDILIVDELGKTEKWRNLSGLTYTDYLHKDDFMELVLNDDLESKPEAIIHMGACSSTTETDADYLMENNYRYTKILAQYSLDNGARFIYASSAATYGDGSNGYSDDESRLSELRPLNMYGYSKHVFDLWALKNDLFDRIVGLKFFNVYGPNEYHKEDMMSVVCKAHRQILDSGKLKLFKSYRPEYKDGGQVRDFICVKDCVEVVKWFMENPESDGLYNLGTGKARSWLDLAAAVFDAMGRKMEIEFIEMPESIRDKYQYHTEAEMKKLRDAGYSKSFRTLEEGVREYVEKYLAAENRHLGKTNY